jgi:hypothetical protein
MIVKRLRTETHRTTTVTTMRYVMTVRTGSDPSQSPRPRSGGTGPDKA